jgi:cytosine/adenosine deaminase-related metal-dependent hydrolase
MVARLKVAIATLILCALWDSVQVRAQAQIPHYDVVINHGRVIDPETGLDGIRNIGINGNSIAIVTDAQIEGKKTIDAQGLIVGPGFVDLHMHAINVPSFWMQAFDGVTTALELEAGAFPIKKAYALAASLKLPLNFGFSASWAAARMSIADNISIDQFDGSFEGASKYFGWPKWSKLLTPEKSSEVVRLIEQEMIDGGLGIGVTTGYAPKTNREEYVALNNLAVKYDVPTYNHLRTENTEEPAGAVEGFLEGIGIAAATGSRFHIAHINSTALRKITTVIPLIEKAQGVKLRITTEAYPWGSGSTVIGAPFLNPSQLPLVNITSKNVFYVKTGEHIDSQERLAEIQKSDPSGLAVIQFLDESKPNEMALIDDAILFKDTMIASDAVPFQVAGKTFKDNVWPLPDNVYAHPRSAATYTVVIARYVRDMKQMTLIDLFRRASLLPANLVASASPMAKLKGRIQPGMDADIIMFDLTKVKPRANYINPRLPSEGMVHVIVQGQFVIEGGQLNQDVRPGRPLMSALQKRP